MLKRKRVCFNNQSKLSTTMKILTHWTLAFVTVIIVTLFHYNDNYVVETARLKGFDLLQQNDEIVHSADTVSYTHLTLPTILRV